MCTKKVPLRFGEILPWTVWTFCCRTSVSIAVFDNLLENMYMDIRDFSQTCDTCLQAKRDYSHKTRPLNPLQVAEGPFHTWAIDHKDLCRKTTGGLLLFSVVLIVFQGGQFWLRFLVWMQRRLHEYFLKR